MKVMILTALLPVVATAANAIVPLELVVDPPTPFALGVAWTVEGDDDRDATVTFELRRPPEPFRPVMPLFRPESRVFNWDNFNTPGNLFAGSAIDLQPGTEYELRLTLHDPDGGDATKVVRARTRALPRADAAGQTRYVAPGNGGGQGTRSAPFLGLAEAARQAVAGDTFLLLPGTYRGPVRFTQDGREGSPIVFRAEQPGTVVFDAAGETGWFFDFSGRRYNHLELITLIHAKRALKATGATGMVVRSTVMKDFPVGTSADKTWGILVDDNRDGYFCDNELLGPEPDLNRDRAGYGPSYNFELSGQGNVICHNLLTHWWDAITSSEGCYRSPTCLANDINNNLILYATDDAIELDGSLRNVRAVRNRIGSSFGGISVQPAYGGPIYVVRNEVFSSQRSPLKLNPAYAGLDGPSGVVVLHNSLAGYEGAHGGTWSNVMMRNNILYATTAYSLQDSVMAPDGQGFDFDYDSFHYTGAYAFRFSFAGNLVRRWSVPELCAATGDECHGSAFTSRALMWPGLPEPVQGQIPFAQDAWAFTLAESAPAVDSALRLPGINDSYVGIGPDRGALERGAPAIQYGPRPFGLSEPVMPASDGGSTSVGSADAGAGDSGTPPEPAPSSDAASRMVGGCNASGHSLGLGLGLWAALGLCRRRRRAAGALLLASSLTAASSASADVVTWQWNARASSKVQGLSVLPGGHVLISEKDNGEILEVKPEFPSGGEVVWRRGGLRLPDRVSRQASGNTLVAEPGANRVVEFDEHGLAVWTFGDGAGGCGAASAWLPTDAWRAPSGHTFIATQRGNQILEVDSAGQKVWHYGRSDCGSGSALDELHSPFGVQPRANGELLVADIWNHRVISIRPQLPSGGTVSWQFGVSGVAGSGPGMLNQPLRALELDNGNILIVDGSNHRVIEVHPSATGAEVVWQYGVTGQSGNGADQLAFPYDAARLPNGATLIAERDNSRVQLVVPDDAPARLRWVVSENPSGDCVATRLTLLDPHGRPTAARAATDVAFEAPVSLDPQCQDGSQKVALAPGETERPVYVRANGEANQARAPWIAPAELPAQHPVEPALVHLRVGAGCSSAPGAWAVLLGALVLLQGLGSRRAPALTARKSASWW